MQSPWAESIRFDLGTGGRFGLPTPRSGFEISFMGLMDWNDSETFALDGGELYLVLLNTTNQRKCCPVAGVGIGFQHD